MNAMLCTMRNKFTTGRHCCRRLPVESSSSAALILRSIFLLRVPRPYPISSASYPYAQARLRTREQKRRRQCWSPISTNLSCPVSSFPPCYRFAEQTQTAPSYPAYRSTQHWINLSLSYSRAQVVFCCQIDNT